MARIDQAPIEPQAPRPIPTPFANPNVSADSQGAAIGQGVSDLAAGGAAVAREMRQAREEADHSVVQGAQGDLLTTAAAKMAAFKQQTGSVAVEKSTDLALELDEDASKVLGKLQDKRQQQAFGTWWQLQRAGYRSAIEDHTQQQLRVVYDEGYKAKSTALKDQIATNFDNPVARALAISDLARTEAANAIRQGQPPEAVAQAAKSAQGTGYGIVLESLIKRDRGDEAAALFTPDVQAALGVRAADFAHGITIAGAKQEGERKAMQIVHLATDPGAKIADEAKAFKMLDTMPVGAAKDEATDRLKQKLQIQKAILGQEHDVKFAQARAQFLAQPQGQRSIAGVDASLVAYFRNPKNYAVDKWAALEGLEREDRTQAFTLPPTAAQSAAWGEFQYKAQQSPEVLAQLTPAEYYSKWGPLLTPQQRDHGFALLASAQGAKSELSADVHNEIKRIGTSAGLWGKDGPKQADQFTLYAALSDAARATDLAWKKEHGGKGGTPMAEITKTLIEKTAKGDVQGTGILFTDTVRRVQAETNPDYAGKAFLVTDKAQVPSADRTIIESLLRQNGKPVTDQAILKAYNDVKNARRGAPVPAPAASAPRAVLPLPAAITPTVVPVPPLPDLPGPAEQWWDATKKAWTRTPEEAAAEKKKPTFGQMLKDVGL